MQMNLTGHHIYITRALRDYVDNKIVRIGRHFDSVTDIHVILSVEKLRHKAEATMHVSGRDLYADATEEDMYAAIDGLVDKLDRQVKKYREKVTDHHAKENQKLNRFF